MLTHQQVFRQQAQWTSSTMRRRATSGRRDPHGQARHGPDHPLRARHHRTGAGRHSHQRRSRRDRTEPSAARRLSRTEPTAPERRIFPPLSVHEKPRTSMQPGGWRLDQVDTLFPGLAARRDRAEAGTLPPQPLRSVVTSFSPQPSMSISWGAILKSKPSSFVLRSAACARPSSEVAATAKRTQPSARAPTTV